MQNARRHKVTNKERQIRHGKYLKSLGRVRRLVKPKPKVDASSHIQDGIDMRHHHYLTPAACKARMAAWIAKHGTEKAFPASWTKLPAIKPKPIKRMATAARQRHTYRGFSDREFRVHRFKDKRNWRKLAAINDLAGREKAISLIDQRK